MARLNTAAPPRKGDPRPRPKSSFQTGPASSRAEPTASTQAITKGAKQWTMENETGTSTPSSKTALPRSQSQRSGKGSGSGFDIFHDADETREREGEGVDDTQSSRGSSGGEGMSRSKSPLKSAKVNSLLLPVPQQARTRPARKSEVDYDKENDLGEGEVDDLPQTATTTTETEQRQSPARRERGLGQTPGRRGNGRQFQAFREPTPSDSEDNGFDSLDDFIVSDNEEVPYQETSESETDDATPPPPPPARRRLFRGRRPDPEAEVKRELESPSQKEALRLEPSVPSELTMPSLMPDSQPKRVSQDELNADEEMDRLSLENNDVSCQLEKDLHQVVGELDSPSQQSESAQEILPETPPSSPSKKPVLSPTKRKVEIPASPHRQSADAFWSQEVTNDWVDQHSPRKLEQLLKDFEDSDNDTSDSMLRSIGRREPKTPSKTALKRAETEKRKAQLARKKSFDNKKASLAEDFLNVVDDAVTGGQIQGLTEETGGVKIVWSKTLQKTAGRANWKRDRSAQTAPTDQPHPHAGRTPKHQAYIELAERVIDDEDRLINTLAHEYCHLANFMISGVHNNPHGASFKQWGRKCKDALRSHPVYGGRVEVTTKHSYKIDYKYVWSCVDCGQTYGRHSKSIDTARLRCSVCRGFLQQIKPKPRNVSPRKQQGEKRAVDDMTSVLGEITLHS